MTLISLYDALLLDLDGTVWESGRSIPGAVDSIRRSEKPAVYVTNNASRSSDEIAQMLQTIGIKAEPKDVLTSAHAAVKMAVDSFGIGTKALVLGTNSFKELANKSGLQVVSSANDKPACVLQGHSTATGWAELSEAAYAIRAGAKYLASNLDTSLPTKRGLAVGNGSMVAAVVSATGIKPVSAGKPEPAMFLQAAANIGAVKPLAVGDRLDTDILGGNRANMDTLYVATGVSSLLDVLDAPEEMRPTYIGSSMNDLFSPVSELIPSPQGEFTSRIDGNDILLSGGNAESTPIQALRTIAQVAWATERKFELIRPQSEAAERVLAKW
ncbi:HAD-IIA family hydrolase [Corynebacterium caspium]|uniref:HAD-IIA family hydrolase n=1 Tax=Corynebacterium caspium TaxID=234828 RepID=UPI00036928B8|nr:HAD-IIA family hydrolase [Corynebacterium caspium]WKD59355.1 putative hydrolase YutF [Corynebacterium caspium DSM 44850]